MQQVIKSAIALAVVAGAAMSANGAVKQFGALEPTSLGGSRFALRGTTDGIGFEAGEGYVQGDITGQQGWLTTNPPNGRLEVRNGVNSGNGSANALRLSVGTQAQGVFGIAEAPLALNSTSMSVDTRIDDNGGGNYFVRGLGFSTPTTTFLAFRVEFDYRGTIFLQSPIDGSFVDTLVPWARNMYRPLTISYTATTISYQYGTSSLGTTPVSLGGAFFDIVQFGHDNFQAFGGGPISTGGDPAAGYFDNLIAIPTPGALALLGLGGLVAGRRRRA